jgi:hypothetical protein
MSHVPWWPAQPGSPQATAPVRASLDGQEAADHDRPYRFGRRPTSLAPYPFSTRQYVRLLILRSRVEAGLVGLDDRRAE